ncbi:flagellar motor switch phosphatase FliY [Bacillus sp. B1-b2]|uniref:flagellar motor switch phosphatase FliY n=1 Tax=Bacillus sp. B1-b2 TaxID=2653201 RepID=UPI0012615BFA|nr:flagellar motor switch phosphatase FliY [Bacillus sp. B1-b2]KAB7668649.1 flagellar motor switch phosphatase FliY [Bacillus sp. B1-b2]
MVSKDMLSQDEIDALLRGDDQPATQEIDLNQGQYLSDIEKDALGEIGNISFGSSATALSTLLNHKVDITTPSVSVVLQSQLSEEFPHPYVAIRVNYTEGFSGMNLLVIKQSDAAVIADLMLGGDGTGTNEALNEIQFSAVQEAMNQMMGSAATSMSTIFAKRVDISPPSMDILDFNQGEGTANIPQDEMFVKISFRIKIGELIDSNIMQLLQISFAKSLVDGLLNPTNNEEEVSNISNVDYNSVYEPKEPIQEPQATPHYSQGSQTSGNMTNMGEPVGRQQNQQQYFGSNNHTQGPPPSVQPAVFSSFETVPPMGTETKNLDMLMDIPLQVTVELGRTKRSVKEILELSSGSIIELDKLAGEPVDILVNNRLVAQGEVVVIDENFGVRVTDIVSQKDRLKKLR